MHVAEDTHETKTDGLSRTEEPMKVQMKAEARRAMQSTLFRILNLEPCQDAALCARKPRQVPVPLILNLELQDPLWDRRLHVENQFSDRHIPGMGILELVDQVPYT